MLSQQALSQRTGIGIDKIRAYEFNQTKPPEAHLAKLIEVFGDKLVSGLSEQCMHTAETDEC